MISQTSFTVATIVSIASLAIATPLLPGQGSATFYPSLTEQNYTPKDLNILACHTRPDVNEFAAKKIDINFPMDAAAGAFAAMSDHSPLWLNSKGEECAKNPDNPKAEPSCLKQPTCGQCYEIACAGIWEWPGETRNEITHPNACKRGNSVVVKILDACPAEHSNNLIKGAKNFCSLRQNHFDLYRPAFRHIANVNDGEIRMTFSKTDCGRVGYYTNGQKLDQAPLSEDLNLPTANGRRFPKMQ